MSFHTVFTEYDRYTEGKYDETSSTATRDKIIEDYNQLCHLFGKLARWQENMDEIETDFNIQCADTEILGHFFERYCDLMPNLEPLSEDSSNEQMTQAMNDLLHAHRMIHFAFVGCATKEWQNLYFTTAIETERQSGMTIIPDAIKADLYDGRVEIAGGREIL